MGKKEAVLGFLSKYAGKTSPLLLDRELQKNGIADLEGADRLKTMDLAESIVKDILTPILSKGRIPLARSELMGKLGIQAEYSGIPTEIDGVRVLPDTIREIAADQYSTASEYILGQELRKYGLKGLGGTDSKTRIKILEAFVGAHFGQSGKAIIDCRIDEMGVRDVCASPAYQRILLVEYVLQSMLAFYVNPIKARMLRSELLTILDMEPTICQAADPEVERANRQIIAAGSRNESPCAAKLRADFEDLLAFLMKREQSRRGIRDLKDASEGERNDVVSAVLALMLGGMTSAVFSRIMTDDQSVRSKFYLLYCRNYLAGLMPKEEVERFFVRVGNLLGQAA